MQIIPREPDARIPALEQGQVGYPLEMANVELRNSARPDLDVGEGRLLLRNVEYCGQFAMDGGEEFGFRERRCLGIRHAAEKTGKEHMIFWGAAGEKR